MRARPRARHAARSPVPFGLLALVLVVVAGGVVAWRLGGRGGERVAGSPAGRSPAPSATASPSASPTA
ncbi:MAG: hypothetical protein ACE14W_08270, partial [Candidatus Velamenicoccus archaeovorus]